MKAVAPTRRLMLLRHGKAVRGQPGESDFERGLVPRGEVDAAGIGAYLAHHRLVPDRILVSPAVRARNTWAQAAVALLRPPATAYEPRLYDANATAILALIREVDGAPTVMVVGHNPGLHELAMMLIASGDVEMRERLQEDLPTSGLVVIDFAVDAWRKVHPQSGRLELFVVPKTLDTAVD